MEADYRSFEEKYRRLRAGGAAWNTPDQLAVTLANFSRFFDLPGVPRSGRALELGCGAGDFSLWLADHGYEVSGVDISAAAIQWARERFADRGLLGDFHVASALDLSQFADGFFDIVLDGHCFHCIIGNDRKIFLSSARRVLRPNGIIHIATMCGEIHDPEVRARFDPETQCVMRDGIATRQVKMPGEVLREIEAAGFHILNWEVDPAKTVRDQDDLLVNARK